MLLQKLAANDPKNLLFTSRGTAGDIAYVLIRAYLEFNIHELLADITKESLRTLNWNTTLHASGSPKPESSQTNVAARLFPSV